MHSSEFRSLKRRAGIADEPAHFKRERLHVAGQEFPEEKCNFVDFGLQSEAEWKRRFSALAQLARDAGVRDEDIEAIRTRPLERPAAATTSVIIQQCEAEKQAALQQAMEVAEAEKQAALQQAMERAEAEKRAALHQAMARAEVEKQAAFALGWRAQALALVAPREGPPSPRVSTPTKDEEVMMAWEPVP